MAHIRDPRFIGFGCLGVQGLGFRDLGVQGFRI